LGFRWLRRSNCWKSSFPTPNVSFSPLKNSILSLIYESKTSVNGNRNFEKFGKHLPKFCDIETAVSTVYFSKNSIKKLRFLFTEVFFHRHALVGGVSRSKLRFVFFEILFRGINENPGGEKKMWRWRKEIVKLLWMNLYSAYRLYGSMKGKLFFRSPQLFLGHSNWRNYFRVFWNLESEIS
jgi:hypothetical protein